MKKIKIILSILLLILVITSLHAASNKVPTSKILYKVFYFSENSSNIEPSDNSNINEIIQYMKANASAKLLVVGHSDEGVDLKYNEKLAFERAFNVLDKINKSGINYSRLKLNSFDFTKPVKPYMYKKVQKPKNRRVEIYKVYYSGDSQQEIEVTENTSDPEIKSYNQGAQNYKVTYGKDKMLVPPNCSQSETFYGDWQCFETAEEAATDPKP